MTTRRSFFKGLARVAVAVALLPREWAPLPVKLDLPRVNVLDTVLPQLLAQGLLVLREESVMQRLVDKSFEEFKLREGL